MFTGISNFRYMEGLFDCLQYHLLLVDDVLCKRKFVLYFRFVAIFCTFCGPFYYLTRRLIFRLYLCITGSLSTTTEDSTFQDILWRGC